MTGRGPVPEVAAYSESMKAHLAYAGAPLTALRTRREKLIHAPRPELYDLELDPGERENLAAALPGRVEELLRHLARRLVERKDEAAGAAARGEDDAERREMLESLGYVGGREASPEFHELEREGFDPKDLVDVAMAGRDLENGFDEAARRKLDRFFRTTRTPAEDPSLGSLWSLAHQNVAVLAMRQGDFAAAARAHRAALEADAGNPDSRWGLLFALSLDGRPAEAVAAGAPLVEMHPADATLRLHFAVALALAGRRDEAREELRAVGSRSSDPEMTGFARGLAGALGTPDEPAWLERYLAAGRVNAGG
jgi:hypothetical protein